MTLRTFFLILQSKNVQLYDMHHVILHGLGQFGLSLKAKMKKICLALFFPTLFLYFSNFKKSKFLLHKQIFFIK